VQPSPPLRLAGQLRTGIRIFTLDFAKLPRMKSLVSPLMRLSRLRPTLTTLIFHRVLSELDPLQPDIPDRKQFAELLQFLKKNYVVLSGPEAIRGLHSGRLPAGALTITFDDGYADNFHTALPELRNAGLTATFFIASDYLDGSLMFNDVVIESVRVASGPRLAFEDSSLGTWNLDSVNDRRDAIAGILGRIKYLGFSERNIAARKVASAAGLFKMPRLMMTQHELIELARAGMTIGGHTASHPILARQSESEALADIVKGKGRLEEILGSPVTMFAYPNGRPDEDFRREHVGLVRQAGYQAAFTTAPGAADRDGDLLQIPRFTPWDRPGWKFALRLLMNQHTRITYAS
jgi:peptidoglycan/xylan/chitin deacetylase (PgdA/CDA1 family)